jgi:hypothetical protein
VEHDHLAGHRFGGATTPTQHPTRHRADFTGHTRRAHGGRQLSLGVRASSEQREKQEQCAEAGAASL